MTDSSQPVYIVTFPDNGEQRQYHSLEALVEAFGTASKYEKQENGNILVAHAFCGLKLLAEAF